MKATKIYLFILLVSLPLSSLIGQSLGLYASRHLFQSTHLQPARFMNSRVTMAIPGFSTQFVNPNFTLNDILVKDGDSTILDEAGFLATLDEENSLYGLTRIEPIAFAITFDKWQLMFGTKGTATTYLRYPKALVDILLNGNQKYVGQSVKVSPHGQVIGTTNFYAGAAFKIGNNIRIGGRAHFVLGWANISAEKGDFALYTDPDNYQIAVDQSLVVQTSVINWNQETESEINPFTFNPGFAFDLGAEWDITDRITASASIVNVGAIAWNDQARTYTFSGVDEFPGIVFNGIKIDSISYEAQLDSFLKDLEPTETEEAFTSPLQAHYFLSGEYKFNNGFAAGVIYEGRHYFGDWRSSFAITGRKSFGETLHLGLIYAFKEGDQHNLGINLDVRAGPFGFYFITDHLISLINFRNATAFDMQFGFNWYFGRRAFQQEESLE